MSFNKGFFGLLLASAVGLTACVPPPPHQTVVYRESSDQGYSGRSDQGYPPPRSDQGYPPPRAEHGYPPPADQGYSNRCQTCGTIRDVARVEIHSGGTSGGGAVLGAIIGGLVGNQFGGGSGKAAMTAAGVVGGAAAGNAIEANNNAAAASGSAWRYRVQLDDGRMATVTQYDNPGFHPGNRVVIRGDHIVALHE
jgi:outer membrane lipoprotein SlyB